MRANIPQVTLSAVDNGWIVSAGCLSLAFTNNVELGTELMKFLANPEEVTKQYTEKYRRPMTEERLGREAMELGRRGRVSPADPCVEADMERSAAKPYVPAPPGVYR